MQRQDQLLPCEPNCRIRKLIALQHVAMLASHAAHEVEGASYRRPVTTSAMIGAYLGTPETLAFVVSRLSEYLGQQEEIALIVEAPRQCTGTFLADLEHVRRD